MGGVARFGLVRDMRNIGVSWLRSACRPGGSSVGVIPIPYRRLFVIAAHRTRARVSVFAKTRALL